MEEIEIEKDLRPWDIETFMRWKEKEKGFAGEENRVSRESKNMWDPGFYSPWPTILDCLKGEKNHVFKLFVPESPFPYKVFSTACSIRKEHNEF